MRASESERAISCPASLALPKDPRGPNEARDKAANWGTLVHWWKENNSTEMPGASKSDVLCLDKKLLLSGIDREEWWPTGKGEHETAFAFNLKTHTVKWYTGDKKAGDDWKAGYYQRPEWITGTCDWSAEGPLLIKVDDLKTGRWPVSATDNKQLLTYAMPFWLRAGKPLVCLIHLSITQWERYPLTGLPKRNWWKASGLEMMTHLQDLEHALNSPGEMNPTDENCRFCDCKNNCPAFMTSGISFERH
mgnify:CR=1 FL=1